MGLVAFDFDGTLSASEMVVLLARRAGAADEVSRVTERAMAGELGYAESLRRRVAFLEGLPETEAARAYDGVALRDGFGDLIDDLAAAGHRTAVLTGGFEAGVRAALDRADCGVDRVVANRLPVAEGSISGTVEGPLVEGSKGDVLFELSREWNLNPEDVVAVGDGANDLPMLESAGLSVGFDPKPAVEPACDAVVGDVAALRGLFVERGLLDAGRAASD